MVFRACGTCNRQRYTLAQKMQNNIRVEKPTSFDTDMERTVSASLNGRNFIFEDSAYRVLNSYMRQYRAALGQNDKDNEMKAVEVTVAQLLGAKIGSSSAIDRNMVRETIDRVGMPAGAKFEYREDSRLNNGNGGLFNGRKLYRSIRGGMVAGVCSGLGIFLGIDPWLIRIIFILAAVFGLSGFWIYLLLWIVIPCARTPEERCNQYGYVQTDDNIRKFR